MKGQCTQPKKILTSQWKTWDYPNGKTGKVTGTSNLQKNKYNWLIRV